MSDPAVPKRGPGRPSKVPSPQSPHQARLADAVTSAEAARDLAEAAYAKKSTVATETALLAAELTVATAWSAYLRSSGDHTHGLKYGDIAVKVAGRIAALRELAAIDQLEALVSARSKRSDALGKRGKK